MQEFDYILAMDHSNMESLSRLSNMGDAEVQMFLSYANALGTTSVEEMPDPYYSGGYDRVYALVHTGSTALLQYLRKQHNL